MTGPSSPWNQRAQIISAVTTDFNAAVIISDKLAATDQPTATVSRIGMSTIFSLTLVGSPSITDISDVWKPRLGPNYRR
jgi:hypothetical protein